MKPAAIVDSALASHRTRESEGYDAVLLDMNMPGMGGMNACREIRLRAPALPILIITIRDSQEEKIEAFEAGADDYVTKPFQMRELTARVRAAVRRSHLHRTEPDQSLRIGEITLNPSLRTVHKTGQPIHMTPKEFDLLFFLMTNAGTPLPHNRLLTAVWGAEYGGEMEYLRTFIHQLRKKLETIPPSPPTCSPKHGSDTAFAGKLTTSKIGIRFVRRKSPLCPVRARSVRSLQI